MRTITLKTGTTSVRSVNFIFVIGESMSMPTIIRAGPYAKAGMAVKKGAKNSAPRNRKAVTTEVNPDPPPPLYRPLIQYRSRWS